MRTVTGEGEETGPAGKTALAAAALLVIVSLTHLPAQLNPALPKQGQGASLVLLFMASIGSAKTLAP